MRLNMTIPYRTGRAGRPRGVSAKGALLASARTCTLTDETPARRSSNRASGAHRPVANVLLTPLTPPQVTELSSDTRTGSRARWAASTAPTTVRAMPAVARSLSTRAMVGYVGSERDTHAEYG